MKKYFYFIALCFVAILAGCMEITQEITINDDGSGTYSKTTDMSAMLGLMKQMGKGKSGDMEEASMDTSIQLSSRADSIAGLTAEEKEWMKTGVMRVQVSIKDEKSITNMQFPFADLSQINGLSKLSSKIVEESVKSQAGDSITVAAGMEELPPMTSMDDYFDTQFSKGLLIRTVNKEKYAKADKDEYLKGMKEAVSMGLPMTSTIVINLPRPASKVEGKNVKISEDKKKLTIKVDIQDFFDDPSMMEFRIEY